MNNTIYRRQMRQRIRNVIIAANPGITEHRIMVKIDAPATYYRLLLYYNIGMEFDNSPKYWAVGKLTEFESETHFFAKISSQRKKALTSQQI